MSIKILHRRSKLAPTSRISIVPNITSPQTANYGVPVNMLNKISDYFPHRKSASGDDLSFLQRVAEFIRFRAPSIPFDKVSDVLQKIKVPGLALLGVAFVAGVSFLAYKLYSHWSDKKVNETVDKIMRDFEAATPELLSLPGWRDQVRNEVLAAVRSGDDASMVEQIVKIKTAIVEKQQSMGHAVGAGIDLFDESEHLGAGLIMPL